MAALPSGWTIPDGERRVRPNPSRSVKLTTSKLQDLDAASISCTKSCPFRSSITLPAVQIGQRPAAAAREAARAPAPTRYRPCPPSSAHALRSAPPRRSHWRPSRGSRRAGTPPSCGSTSTSVKCRSRLRSSRRSPRPGPESRRRCRDRPIRGIAGACSRSCRLSATCRVQTSSSVERRDEIVRALPFAQAARRSARDPPRSLA